MEDVLQLSNLCLVVLVFLYSLNLGPMLFESFTSDRTWASHPPESFSMFLGPYGYKTKHYWRIVSPLASLLFVVSLILNWHSYARVLWLAGRLCAVSDGSDLHDGVLRSRAGRPDLEGGIALA